MDTYTVKSGDNLTRLASQFGTTIGALTQANNISNPNMIKAGQTLTIPKLNQQPQQPTQVAPTIAPPAVQSPAQTVITASSIQNPPQPVQVPQAIPSVPTPPMNEADRILQAINVQDTEAQQFAQKQSLDIASLVSQLAGQSEAKTSALEASGYNAKRQELQDINAQVLNKTAEIQKDDIQLLSTLNEIEKKAITGIAIRGQQRTTQKDAQLARALKVSEIGVLNAQALAKQGDIQLAMDTANSAVEAKFAPIREQLDIMKAQLEAIQPILTRDEKKQAQAQDLKLKLELNRIEKQEQEEKTIQNLMLEASKNGAPQSILNNVSKSTSVVEAIQKMGAYSTDPLDVAVKKAQLSKIYQDIAESKTKSVAGGGTSGTLKALSGDAAKVFSIANSLPQDIQAIKNEINKVGYNKFILGVKTGTNRTASRLVSNAADKIGRLRSGGAVNVEEEKRFREQLTNIRDVAFGDLESTFKSLDSIAEEANVVVQGIDPNAVYQQNITKALNDMASPTNYTKTLDSILSKYK